MGDALSGRAWWPLATLIALLVSAGGCEEGGARDAVCKCGPGTRCAGDRCVPVGDAGHADGSQGTPDAAIECEKDEACDDGDPCTEDRCAGGVCRHLPLSGNPCDDGDACSEGDHCNDGTCVRGWDLDCDDGDPCTQDGCDPLTGCAPTPAIDGAPCDDGDACTQDDICAAGACAPGPALDCDDGDACNGVERCEPATGCTGGAAPDCDDGLDCTVDTCDPLTGCAATPDDGLCFDGVACTSDRCDPSAGCVFAPDDSACDDGDACTSDRCDPLQGCGTAPVICDDGIACTADACDPLTGCAFLPDDDRCADGDLCNGVERCDPLAGCQASPPPDCDDHVGCTADACDPLLGCTHQPNPQVCSDAEPCNGEEICDLELGCLPAAEPLDCDDGVGCTEDRCELFEGCGHTPRDVVCDDGLGCTSESCDPLLDCVVVPHDDRCEDGSVCTPSDVCTPGVGCTHPDPMVCDDGDPCTADFCDAASGCDASPIISRICRPVFVIAAPARGATLQSADPRVEVRGTVISLAGPIERLTVNGARVPVAADGSFRLDVRASTGANVLVMEALDARGTTYRRVQSFLWSPQYSRPDLAEPGSGMSDPAAGLFLGQETIDDGDRAPPIDDLGTLLEQLLAGFDIAALLPNPIAQVGPFSITSRGARTDPPVVHLTALAAGIRVEVIFANVHVDLLADGGFAGSSDGTADATDVTIESWLRLVVVDGALVPALDEDSVRVSFNNLVIAFDSQLVNDRVPQIQPLLESAWRGAIRDAFVATFRDELGPVLAFALDSLAGERVIELPALAPPGATISITLRTDFVRSQHLSRGVLLELRGGAYGQPITPYQNLGVAERVGCGARPHDLRLFAQAPLEQSLADDLLNQIFYAGWVGGLLEFQVPDERLAEIAPAGVGDMTLVVSGMLAPMVSDCVGRQALVTIGDLRIDATLTLLDQPLTAVIYTTFTARMTPRALPGGVVFEIGPLVSANTEVQVAADEQVGLEASLVEFIEADLLPAVVADIGGLTLELAPLDLGGGASIRVQIDTVLRTLGNTLLQGAPVGEGP